MNQVHEKLAKILRTDPQVLLNLEKEMEGLTGKTGVLEKVTGENQILAVRTLEELGLSRESSADKVYQVLVDRLKHTDEHLNNFLEHPDLSKMANVCGKLCAVALQLNQPKPGFFIKKEKAVQMLEKFPPQNLLDFFGYSTVAELVEKQGFSSVFSALRFAQDTAWMHRFFEEAYNDLTADDFEEREVELKVLEPEWLKVAEKFLEKKYHNVSHLKELGIIFVIPLQIDTLGETLRLFTLILHYLNEVPFYSKLFKKFHLETGFPSKVRSLLRGDVPEGAKPEGSIRIVQRYLAKDDPNDFRLVEPHINPEAEHWYKAEGDLGKLSSFPELKGHIFGYWQGLDFVGDFFPSTDLGQVKLVSFDLIDLVMSLVEKGETKYLYHQQEALWNKIFVEYLGREKVEELVEKNIIEGFIPYEIALPG
ncbi:MAG: hypothetical protein A3C71_01355 [Candidatus Yanofskybacteria bacterium RIFCSPHIGHO2_02_FULL_43_15c]|uniref:Glycosidase related protein n=1 Tax=Candidatus Yanofskybacteria bacterium RIFCSPHIGHO2_02_FULL_43_15c TaxID=1802679 RepID=A0A1F8FHJ7_9BACT|nr:MAG: hypothetical protein A3C71_01355 [Candidatus Yanofskybacteria bacterium RIFCSPHIGHO2_02_FULL_43_15c]